MRSRRDPPSFGGYVVQGAALGVGAFLGAAVVTAMLAFASSKLPFVLKVLPRAPGGGTTP
jgi:hypothetical protein